MPNMCSFLYMNYTSVKLLNKIEINKFQIMNKSLATFVRRKYDEAKTSRHTKVYRNPKRAQNTRMRII